MMDTDICIHVNGEARAVCAGTTLQALVEQLDVAQGQALALAVNRSIVPRQQWRERQVAASDKIDIVRAIGGG